MVYCFNSSDVQINSCLPDPTTTRPSSSAPTDSTASSGSDLTENVTVVPNATETERALKKLKFQVNDGVVFGGIPTALLVLALIFFVTSVVLAVCYIKKYKTTFPFSYKNQKKEMVETTALKEAESNDKTPEKETKNNGKKVEESKSKPETTVKCLEAEV
ncbi:Lymphatic vessel endothelial hyaluronic acid receptor 1 [Aix galericulata]|nr:Lymphatic vessel endothelial hyaluronic acid receptor 1 [Aix galericulata]